MVHPVVLAHLDVKDKKAPKVILEMQVLLVWSERLALKVRLVKLVSMVSVAFLVPLANPVSLVNLVLLASLAQSVLRDLRVLKVNLDPRETRVTTV